MEYRTLGQTNIIVSKAGMGVLPIGPEQYKLSVEEGAKVICHAIESGINFLDTAQYYKTYPYIKRALEMLNKCPGSKEQEFIPRTQLQKLEGGFLGQYKENTAEDGAGNCGNRVFGQTLERLSGNCGNRVFEQPGVGKGSEKNNFPRGFCAEKIVICSKSLAKDYDGMKNAIDVACIEMGLEQIDIFLMHEVRSGQFSERSGAWRALLEAKKNGLVHAIGVSTHHVDTVNEMADVSECDCIFALTNYAGMGIRKGDGPGTREEMEAAIKAASLKGKGIFSMKSFGGGNLTGNYVKALDYAFSVDGVDSVMIGFGSEREVDDLAAYLDGKLKEGFNPDVSEKKVQVNRADCEGCGECIKACASDAISFADDGLAFIDQTKCITCGYCAYACTTRAIIMI